MNDYLFTYFRCTWYFSLLIEYVRWMYRECFYGLNFKSLIHPFKPPPPHLRVTFPIVIPTIGIRAKSSEGEDSYLGEKYLEMQV